MESLRKNLSYLMIHSADSGFTHWFELRVAPSARLRVRGLGYREAMPPGLIDRPRGTGDFLLMWFHDPAWIGSRRMPGTLHPANTVMLWPPGERQFYGHPDLGYRHSWIHFHGGSAAGLVRRNRLPLLRPLRMAEAADFEHALLELHHEFATRRQPDFVVQQNLLENCGRAVLRSRETERSAPAVAPNLIRVRNYLQSVPRQKVTLAELARRAGLSVPHFCAKFKAAFGLPPMDFLIRHRLNHAAALLRNRNLTIAEIAVQAGYDDPFHFSKMFRRQFGSGPRALRERISRK